MRLCYADPPYFGQCGRRYDHFHNDGGGRPFDGLCWDDRETHEILLRWLRSEFPDGWAFSCNPVDLLHLTIADGERIASWCKTMHQIHKMVPTQFAWEPVIFTATRKFERKPMVRDWVVGARSSRKGTHGAKPAFFNAWILDLLTYQDGDELVDLFPGSNGMAAQINCTLAVTQDAPSTQETP